MKKCPSCQMHKESNEFYATGSYCKDCYKIKYENNVARLRDSAKTQSKKRYASNKAECQQEMSAWRKANPQKCSAYCAKYTASKLSASPSWSDTEFEKFVIQELYTLAVLRSKLTGVKHNVDHIVPLNSKIVQGFHCVANLQIITSSANSAKGNRSWPNMP